MGCDIHMYVERRYHEDDKWYCGDLFKTNKDGWVEHLSIYDDRNYPLFATLANVRNYGDTPYLCKPKGMPDDCCDFVNREYEGWQGEVHSASWFTLKELMDWQKKCLS